LPLAHAGPGAGVTVRRALRVSAIGAGIAGMACARAAAQTDAPVDVFDAAPVPLRMRLGGRLTSAFGIGSQGFAVLAVVCVAVVCFVRALAASLRAESAAPMAAAGQATPAH
jgi:2-polyprenyl-6-methoxyphenol hydroxylase-like FAD-dependent oxidoreductase